MLKQFVILYNYDNGVLMLGIFVLVCIILILGVVGMIMGGESKKKG
jgi:hypothetical protein